MADQSDPQFHAAIAELANVLQVAVPVAARMRQRLDEQCQDAERLDTALTRATEAIRQLRPLMGDGTR